VPGGRVHSTVDDEQFPAFSEAAAEHRIQSTLSLPLGVRGNGIGALNLYYKQPAAFSADAEKVGMLFAEQASVALPNAQLYESAYRDDAAAPGGTDQPGGDRPGQGF
jgi:GAF domain-containing protein